MAYAETPETDPLVVAAKAHLDALCVAITDRTLGSEGNRAATEYTGAQLAGLDLAVQAPSFDVMSWQERGARLRVGDSAFDVHSSPYAPGFEGQARLVAAGSLEQLEALDAEGKIILLHGDIAGSQLFPKKYPFYSLDEHQHIIGLLERSGARALITATRRNGSVAGGEYPAPMFEDGDFDIPSVFMTEEEGERLLPLVGEEVSLKSDCRRIWTKANNIIANLDETAPKRVVITAHIDAKKGAPGAIDNATGVTVLLLLAELLVGFDGGHGIDLVVFNGEDHYSAAGEVDYIRQRQGKFDDVVLNINIDGLGLKQGPSCYSFFDLPEAMLSKARATLLKPGAAVEGLPWVQGDHSIFIQHGCPAIAVSSHWFIENFATQNITHTARDNISIVDPEKVAAAARAIHAFVRGL